MKATVAEIGQSRDDWRRQAEVRRLWRSISVFAAGCRQRCARPWRSEFRPRSAWRRPRNPSANDRCLREADGRSRREAAIANRDGASQVREPLHDRVHARTDAQDKGEPNVSRPRGEI